MNLIERQKTYKELIEEIIDEIKRPTIVTHPLSVIMTLLNKRHREKVKVEEIFDTQFLYDPVKLRRIINRKKKKFREDGFFSHT